MGRVETGLLDSSRPGPERRARVMVVPRGGPGAWADEAIIFNFKRI